MGNQFVRIDFDEIENGSLINEFQGPLAYYLLLRKHVWRSEYPAKFPYSPPIHNAYKNGLLAATLSDKHAAKRMNTCTKTISRYREKLLNKMWIFPSRRTALRQVGMYILGWHTTPKHDKRMKEFFLDKDENLVKFLSMLDKAKTSQDQTDLSSTTPSSNGQHVSTGNETEMSSKNREGLTEKPIEIDRGYRSPSATEDMNEKHDQRNDNLDFEKIRIIVDDDRYNLEKVRKEHPKFFPKSELCKEVFRIRNQKFFPSEGSRRKWNKIERYIAEGKMDRGFPIFVAELSAHPTNTPDGDSYSGRFPGPFHEYLDFALTRDRYNQWKLGMKQGLSREELVERTYEFEEILNEYYNSLCAE